MCRKGHRIFVFILFKVIEIEFNEFQIPIAYNQPATTRFDSIRLYSLLVSCVRTNTYILLVAALFHSSEDAWSVDVADAITSTQHTIESSRIFIYYFHSIDKQINFIVIACANGTRSFDRLTISDTIREVPILRPDVKSIIIIIIIL